MEENVKTGTPVDMQENADSAAGQLINNTLPQGPSVKQDTDVNLVKIRGRISTLYTRPEGGFASMTIATGRTGKGFFEHTNFPDIICFQGLADEVAANFKRTDYVSVEGYVRQHKLTSKVKEGSRIKPQEIVATKVERVPSYLEDVFGAPGHYFPPTECVFLLSGIIVNAVALKTPPITIITLAMRSGPRTNNVNLIRVQRYTKDPEAAVALLTPGKHIACAGHIESSKKEGDDGTPLYYENFVAQDIAVS